MVISGREASKKQQYNMQGNQVFSKFLKAVETDKTISSGIRAAEQVYSIKAYSINDITPDEALKLYNSIYSKFYKKNHHMKSSNWFENQLRLFVWIVVCYGHLHAKKIQHMGHQDWEYFEKIFDRKDPKLFEYQCHCLYLENKGKHWGNVEENMLKQIMSTNETKNSKIKWNQVSKQLFQRSNKQCLRTPKQCRERWNNHLDPTKIKGMWRREEYIKMFEFVRDHGKKWAHLVKILNNARNEHSIKNKFNSMVKRHKKSLHENMLTVISEQELYNQIIDKVKSAIYNEKNCKNRNDIEFDLDDDDEIKPNKKQMYEKKPSSYAEKLMQKLMKFGDEPQGQKKKQQTKGEQEKNGAISKTSIQKGQGLKMQQKQSIKNSNNSYQSSSMSDENNSSEGDGEDNEIEGDQSLSHQNYSLKQQNRMLQKFSGEELLQKNNNMAGSDSLEMKEISIPEHNKMVGQNEDRESQEQKQNIKEQVQTEKTLPNQTIPLFGYQVNADNEGKLEQQQQDAHEECV